ncbi:hypothetical protein D3C83_55550 [compost metagenome]
MVDIVDRADTITNIDQFLENIDDIVLGEHPRPGDLRPSKAAIEFHAADCRQIVPIRRKEKIVE